MASTDDKKSIDKAKKKEIVRRLRAEARRQVQPIALGSLAMVASTLCNQAVPKLLGKLLDQKSPTSAVAGSGLIRRLSNGAVESSTVTSLALVVLGGGVASFLRTTMLNRAEDGIAAHLRTDAFRSLLTRRDLEWFQMGTLNETSETQQQEETKGKDQGKNKEKESSSSSPPVDEVEAGTGTTPGAIIAVLNDDVAQVAQMLTKKLANLIRSSCACLFSTYHMIRLNPTLFGLSFSVVPLIGSAAVVLSKFVKKATARQRETSTLSASFAEERLTHIAMVKMSDREVDEVERYSSLQEECVRLGRSVSLVNGMFMGFIFAASSGALFMVFNAGGKAVAAGRMTAGQLTSFATYTFLLGLGTSGISSAMGDIMRGMVSAERLYCLTDSGEDDYVINIEEAGPKEDLDVSMVDSISVKDVSFAYKSNPNSIVLKNISLELKRGTVVALVGKNGSGKTTVASLLAALYQPLSGSITVSSGTDRVDYNSLGRKVQKQLVQVVPQNPAIFNTTILENVKYSNPDATALEAMNALTMANCNGFVSKLENGILAKVGQSGELLSGGQRQRVGLARALLSDPVLLVLDEPTSAQDAEGKAAVSVAVSACLGKDDKSQSRALLLITHRASTLELADVVVVLKEGRIVERGTLKELSANKRSELCELMPDLL